MRNRKIRKQGIFAHDCEDMEQLRIVIKNRVRGFKMSEYKMIVLDLDGTLTNRDKVITPRTKQSLMEAQKRGIRSRARSWCWLPADRLMA